MHKVAVNSLTQVRKAISLCGGNQSLTTPPSDKSLNSQIIPIGPCDVTNKADLERLTLDLESKEPYLSLPVGAAGVSGRKRYPDPSDTGQMKTNLWTEHRGVERHAAAGRQNASVIVISSMTSMVRHSQAHFSYNTAKAATAHLSRMTSEEFAKTGMHINSIAPGYFPSEMTMK